MDIKTQRVKGNTNCSGLKKLKLIENKTECLILVQVITIIMLDISKWMESKQLKLKENKPKCLILARPHEIKRQC